MLRSSHRRCSIKKGVLKIFAKFTGKHLFQSEFCEIFKNPSFTEHRQATASEFSLFLPLKSRENLFSLIVLCKTFHIYLFMHPIKFNPNKAQQAKSKQQFYFWYFPSYVYSDFIFSGNLLGHVSYIIILQPRPERIFSL